MQTHSDKKGGLRHRRYITAALPMHRLSWEPCPMEKQMEDALHEKAHQQSEDALHEKTHRQSLAGALICKSYFDAD